MKIDLGGEGKTNCSNCSNCSKRAFFRAKIVKNEGNMAEKKRILIVDDDTEIRDLLEFDISSSGYFTDTASDGMEGLNKALNNKQANFFILKHESYRCHCIIYY